MYRCEAARFSCGFFLFLFTGVCFALVVPGAAAPTGDLTEDGHRVDVIGGEWTSGYDGAGQREVPLPAVPDWNADIERAVGGLAWGDADGDGDLRGGPHSLDSLAAWLRWTPHA